jgi:predicted nucleotidyltransferase component of viral defense system
MNAMSLKVKIRNLAKQNNMSAQVVLQNYMFERFLERLARSEYHDKFILKGGMLIAAMIGIDKRATMDIDTTLRNYTLDVASLTKAVTAICSLEINDDIKFSFTGIEPIRPEDNYGGYRVSIRSTYDTIITPLHIDITTGDAITPKEVLFSYKTLFTGTGIDIWAYNVEMIMSEKYETILRRGELSTRPRDYYDIYILAKTQPFELNIFHEALKQTANNRKSSFIFDNIETRIDEIAHSQTLQARWKTYQKTYPYSTEIRYNEIIEVIKRIAPK